MQIIYYGVTQFCQVKVTETLKHKAMQSFCTIFFFGTATIFWKMLTTEFFTGVNKIIF